MLHTKKVIESILKKLKIFISILKENVIFTIVYIIGILLSGIAPVFQIFVIKNIISIMQEAVIYRVINSNNINYGILLLFIECIILLFLSISSDLQTMFSELMGYKVNNTIKLNVIEKLKSIDLQCFDDVDFYNNYENMINETDNAISNFISTVTLLFSLLISLIGYFIVLGNFNLIAIVILVVSIIPASFTKYKFSNKKYKFLRSEIINSRKSEYFYSVLTTAINFKEIKTYYAFDFFNKKRLNEFEKYYSNRKKLLTREILCEILVKFFSKVGTCIILIWIFISILNGKTEIALFTSIFLAVSSIENTLEGILSISSLFYENCKSLNFYICFMENNNNITSGKLIFDNESNIIEFKNVSFRYLYANKDIFKKLSFKIEGKGLTLILGENGSGKSTLIKLLLRLYDVTEGEVLLNNINIKDYSLESIYNSIICVFQDYGKYYITIKENIELGIASEAHKLKEALKESTANEFIDDLDRGIYTELGKVFNKKGIELSIGQNQKLAITRALLRESKVLILDEPTSSIDAISEKEIFNIINENKRKKTIICITHKLYLAPLADNIIFLEGGLVEASGSHTELIKKNEKYKKLYESCKIN